MFMFITVALLIRSSSALLSCKIFVPPPFGKSVSHSRFCIKSVNLNEHIMKESKKIVLKTHPDKSKLEPKYFLFFSQAYKRLYSIYEFQNKKKIKVEDKNEYYDANNTELLNKMFDKDKDLKKPKNFGICFT